MDARTIATHIEQLAWISTQESCKWAKLIMGSRNFLLKRLL